MLKPETDFPHPGSRAFIRGTAQPARILQHRANDGTVLVSLADPRDPTAQGTLTLPLGELYPTASAAALWRRPVTARVKPARRPATRTRKPAGAAA